MAATKKTHARIANHAAAAHADPVASARAHMDASAEDVRSAHRALVLAQRAHADAKTAWLREIEDRDTAERDHAAA
ncbi:hypothetical protein [Paraburkholderia sp. BCC1876]|uniref:hypothetical protein n=1 Tax=Paraburkholderia sp. BCC1876 TaxID=2676303 RepID=UPI001591FA2A|nr:hypothetical protein [Paraburkholderia sp. BCC1876]